MLDHEQLGSFLGVCRTLAKMTFDEIHFCIGLNTKLFKALFMKALQSKFGNIIVIHSTVCRIYAWVIIVQVELK